MYVCVCVMSGVHSALHTHCFLYTHCFHSYFSLPVWRHALREGPYPDMNRERERERASCVLLCETGQLLSWQRTGGIASQLKACSMLPVYVCVCVRACVFLCQPMRCLSSLYLIELHISGIQYINRNCQHSSRRSSKTRLVFLVWENTWNLYLTSTTCAILKRVFFSPLVQWLWLFCTKTQIYLVWIFVLLVLCMWDSGPNLCVFNLGWHTVWTHKCSCLIMKLSVSCYVLVICLCVFMLYLYIWE